MSTEEKLADLIERLRASGTANAPRDSDGIYMSICDEAASAISRLSAEVQQLREALTEARNALTKAQISWLAKLSTRRALEEKDGGQ